MAIDNPSIFCGDDTADLEMQIVKTCNLDLKDYYEDNRVLTRDIFHHHFDEILDLVEGWVPEHPEYNNIAFQVLGAFILRIGAKLPNELKRKIIESTNWETDKKINWSHNWIRLRQFYLKDLRVKIKDYKYGNITYLVNLGLIDDKELEVTSIGLKQYEDLVLNGLIDSICYINLDSCNLKKISDSLFELESLRILSLNGNQLTFIPEEIGKLNALEELHLRYNNINQLPDVLGRLQELRMLDLSFNQLTTIPKFILRKGESHYSLYLHNNPIKDFPHAFKRFVQLDFSFMNESYL